MNPNHHPILTVDSLNKVYPNGTEALKHISFTVHPGEFVAVIGPSGAGKSTLLRCINRLVTATSGTLTFKGLDVLRARSGDVRKLRREIGIIFQQFHLIDRVTVLRNVLHGRLGYMNTLSGTLGLFSKADREEAFRILERVGLGDKAYSRADELSGGQQQRVAIARALLQKPNLLLADEPIASLDPATSETIMQMLRTICDEDGIPCLVNLHQVEAAKAFATRIIGIYKGSKVFDGPPEELTDEMIRFIYHSKLPDNEQGSDRNQPPSQPPAASADDAEKREPVLV